MKIPTRIQLALGTLIAGTVALSPELGLHGVLYRLALLAAGVLLFLFNPQAATPEEALELYPPAGANQPAKPPTV